MVPAASNTHGLIRLQEGVMATQAKRRVAVPRGNAGITADLTPAYGCHRQDWPGAPLRPTPTQLRSQAHWQVMTPMGSAASLALAQRPSLFVSVADRHRLLPRTDLRSGRVAACRRPLKSRVAGSRSAPERL
jgi:hypothetical protein